MFYDPVRFIFIIVISFVVALTAGCSDNEPQVKSFSSIVWKGGDHESRGQMAQDLIEKKIIIGKSRVQVKEILGAPDQDDKSFVTYFMNYGNTFGPPHFVHIAFDEKNKKVHEVWVSD